MVPQTIPKPNTEAWCPQKQCRKKLAACGSRALTWARKKRNVSALISEKLQCLNSAFHTHSTIFLGPYFTS
jgi:hypothetical protein